MKICFYSPYIPKHFGGGEKHLLDVARIAAEQHQVYIAVSRDAFDKTKTLSQVKQSYQQFIHGDLCNVKFIESPLGSSQSAISKLLWTARFDAIYYVTDGALFFSLADKNYLHVQIPFTHPMSGPVSRIKLGIWGHKNCNSKFTKQVVEKSWKCKIDTVLNPMVDVSELATKSDKSNIILSVGRFFKQLHSKRQDILIEVFAQMCDEKASFKKKWQLVLAGSVEDEEWLNELKNNAKGYPVIFKTDISRDELVKLYKDAKLFWHAAGFEVDQNSNPQSVEHFGISTVEAMAAGCVPIVYRAGGQEEVLGEDLIDLSWQKKAECNEISWKLINNSDLIATKRRLAESRAENFGSVKFSKKVQKMFSP